MMLKNEFHKAEKLAAEHDVAALQELRKTWLKKHAYASYIGLAALLHLFFSNWLVLRLAPWFAAEHPEACRLGYAAIGMIGLGLYFGLSKRCSENSQLTELAIELRKRSSDAKKDA